MPKSLSWHALCHFTRNLCVASIQDQPLRRPKQTQTLNVHFILWMRNIHYVSGLPFILYSRIWLFPFYTSQEHCRMAYCPRQKLYCKFLVSYLRYVYAEMEPTFPSSSRFRWRGEGKKKNRAREVRGVAGSNLRLGSKLPGTPSLSLSGTMKLWC